METLAFPSCISITGIILFLLKSSKKLLFLFKVVIDLSHEPQGIQEFLTVITSLEHFLYIYIFFNYLFINI